LARLHPGPPGGAYSALPDPLAGLRGHYFYREGKIREGKGEEKGRGHEDKGQESE